MINSKEQQEVDALLRQYRSLSPKLRGIFLRTLSVKSEPADEKYLFETKTKEGVICPFCGSHECVVRNGKRNGRQRFKCKATGKGFSTTTGDVLYYSKKDLETWKKYVACFLNRMSLTRCSEECGISRVTAFRWRHKILDSLRVMMGEVRMGGVVEADETFFRVSYSGNHKNSKSGFKMPRKAHKRGNDVKTRGLSKEQVCVPCGITRKGLSVSRIACLGAANNKAIASVLGGHIEAGTMLCTDKSRAYKSLVESAELQHVKIGSGRTYRGVFSIQGINAYHAHLKNFMRGFYGVCTKHMNNYLVYHNFLRGAVGSQRDKVRTLLDHMITVDCFTRCKDISSRPQIPLAA